MTKSREPPWFRAALAGCGIAIAGGLWCLHGWRDEAGRRARVVGEKRAELAALGGSSPSPTVESLAIMDAELEAAKSRLALVRRELTGGAAAASLREMRPPPDRSQAFFDLAASVERMRERTRQAGIAVPAEAAQFGFAAYVNDGPDGAEIASVFRQRQAIEYLVEMLCQAAPKTLVAVKRERPDALNSQPGLPDVVPADAPRTLRHAHRGHAGEAERDFFAFEPRRSVGVPGTVDALAFQVSFVGETAALRSFLNRLAAGEVPVAVRGVEVEPVTSEAAVVDASTSGTAGAASYVLTTEAAPGAAEADDTAPRTVPITTRAPSKFTVTVEFVALATPREDAAN